MTIDKAFEAAKTLHWFCSYNYVGQGDKLYRIMCELGYTPKFSEYGYDTSNPVYESLMAGEIDPQELLTFIQKAFGRDLSTELSPSCG